MVGLAVLKVFGRSIPTTVEEILTERAALVIWDMQWAIAGSATNLPMLLTTIPQLINSARARGHRIVYSQHFSLRSSTKIGPGSAHSGSGQDEGTRPT